MKIVLAAALLGATASTLAQVPSPVVHANKGQSAERQSRDEDACHTWARKRTGFDPVAVAENSTPFQPGKGMTSEPIEAPSTAMGSSQGGATSSGSGEMGAGAQGTGTEAMGASSTGTAGSGGGQMHPERKGMDQSAKGAQGSSGAMGKTGTGGPAGGGKHKPQTFAMEHSADVYNNAFAKCMAGRGYMVEHAKAGENP
jgi:hypothetical protein